MTPIEPIATQSVASLATVAQSMPAQPQASSPATGALGGFGKLLNDGLANVNEKVATADQLVRSFTLDESSVPVHQVTIALEEARLAVDMAMQVRSRLVEAYRELMGMQL